MNYKSKIIKPTELRIGNLVKKDSGNICKITAISEINAHLFNLNRKLPDYISFTDNRDGLAMVLRGIEIAEDWFLKLGLEDTSYSGLKRFGRGDFEVGEYKGEWFLVDREMQLTILIKYVHRLQNVYFELTNEELTF